MILRQMFVSEQLQEEREAHEQRKRLFPETEQVNRYQGSLRVYQSRDIVQNLDLRQKEQVSLEGENRNVRSQIQIKIVCT